MIGGKSRFGPIFIGGQHKLSRRGSAERWQSLAVTSPSGTMMLLDENETPLTPLLSWIDQGGARRDQGRLATLKKESPELVAKSRYVVSLMSWIVLLLTGELVDTKQTLAFELDLAQDPEISRFPVTKVVNAGFVMTIRPPKGSLFQLLPEGLPLVLAGDDKNAELLGALDEPFGHAALLSFGSSVSLGRLVEPAIAQRLAERACVTPSSLTPYSQVEVGIPAGGYGFQWLVRTLRVSAGELETLRAPGPDSPIFVPYLAGNRASRQECGTIRGLSLGVSAAAIVASWLEGVLFDLRRQWSSLAPELAAPTTIIVSGERTKKVVIGPWIAATFGLPVIVQRTGLAGLRGTARIAALATGQVQNFEATVRLFASDEGDQSNENLAPSQEVQGLWNKRYALFLKELSS